MSRRHLPTTVTRFGLTGLVIAIAVLGHWLIPSAIGLIPKLVAIALLVLTALWFLQRWERRRRARR